MIPFGKRFSFPRSSEGRETFRSSIFNVSLLARGPVCVPTQERGNEVKDVPGQYRMDLNGRASYLSASLIAHAFLCVLRGLCGWLARGG